MSNQETDFLAKQLRAKEEELALAASKCAAKDERILELSRELDKLKASRSNYEVLEGTPYSRYAIPIEYLPSRKFHPRWGYSQPPQTILNAWFKTHLQQYVAFLAKMRTAAQQLADIPKHFDESRLPTPAWFGVPFAPFDIVALYTMVQVNRPRIYLEIGSGITTCIAYRAIKDAGLGTNIISIDPEPRAKVDTLCNRIERIGLEECDLSIFDTLQSGDIVFFDGSHRSFMNSDVTVFMIDVLPRLKSGVIIHLHDITLPYDYSEMFKSWYWNEQYLLAVYLIGNKLRIDPLLPTAFICHEEALQQENLTLVDLGTDNPRWRAGGSLWFTHTSAS